MATARRRRRPTPFAAERPNQPTSYDSMDATAEDEDVVVEESRGSAASAHVRDILEAARRRQQQASQAPAAVIPTVNGEDSAAAAVGANDMNEADDLNTPSGRLEQVRRRAPEFEREYRLRLVHRLLMRKVPLDEIASQLGVAVSTIQRDRREIHLRMKQEAAKLDVNSLLGGVLAYYDELGAMSLRIATGSKIATPHRLAAIRTAMQSRKEMGQWLQAAGVFETLKFLPQEDAAAGDLHQLMQLTQRILGGEIEDLEKLGDLAEDELLDDDSNIELML